MKLKFKKNNEGWCVPALLQGEEEKANSILEECYSIQPELAEYSIFLDYDGLNFDVSEIEIKEEIWEILNKIQIEVVEQ